MRRRWIGLPRLVRFLVLHAAAGFVISAALVATLLAADPAGARGLLLEAAGHWWPALLLWLFAGMTFGGAQMGIGLAQLGHGGGSPRGGRVRPALLPAPVAALVAARIRRG